MEQTLENSAGFQEFTNGIKFGFRNSAYKIYVVEFTRFELADCVFFRSHGRSPVS